MSENNEFGAFLTGFFIGGLIGAGAALLLAPQSGEDTREQIKQKGIELSEQASQAAEEARTKAEHALADARKKLDEATQEIQARAKELETQGRVLLEEKIAKKGEGTASEAPPAEGIALDEAAAPA